MCERERKSVRENRKRKERERREKREEEKREEERRKDNIDVRKLTFKQSLWKTFKKDYEVETLKEFFEYWSEHGESDKKMRFEKERSFSSKSRLQRWVKNNFSKTENKLESTLKVVKWGK